MARASLIARCALSSGIPCSTQAWTSLQPVTLSVSTEQAPVDVDSSVLPVAVDEDVGVIEVGDEGPMGTAPLGVVSGAVVVWVTGSSPR